MGQDNRDERCYGIKELANLGGNVAPYVTTSSVGCCPLRSGRRGPHYTAAHLERLIHIRKLQETECHLPRLRCGSMVSSKCQ